MIRKHSCLTPLLILTLALVPLSTACAAGDAADHAGDTVKAAGTLTIKGDCRILTDPNGRKFALIGKLEAANGDQIRVTGKKADRTSCLAGPAIRIETVEKVKVTQTKSGEPGKPEVEIVTVESQGPAASPPKEGQVRMLRMIGTLNDEVKAKDCQGLRNFRGELWALTGDLKGLKSGDKVDVEGLDVGKSEACGYPTLKITNIQPFKE
jgi:hypothetical protein